MKHSYAIFADITCELGTELRARFEVDGYLKSYFSGPNAQDAEGRLDMSDAELDAFYASLKANKNAYKTAAPGVSEVAQYFETFLSEGQDILALSLSSTLSATYNIMVCAAKGMGEKYPERKIFIVDSLKYSAALGLLTIKACGLRAEGYTVEQNARKLEEIKMSVHQMGSVDDLFWVASKGRISHAKAFFGTLAGVKAMGDFDANGMVTALAKVSGWKKAFKTTVEYIKKTIRNAEGQTVLVAHSARRAQAEILAALVTEQIKPKEVVICSVQQISGINVGPGLLAAYYFGDEITDLKREKEIITGIVAKL